MALARANKRRTKKLTIEGIIIPSDKNKTGMLNRISIRTPDGKEYLIDYSGVGKELVNFVHKKVGINGELRERLDGRTIINISAYKIFEEHNGKKW